MLWVQGKFIGNCEDSGTIAGILNGLTRLLNLNGNRFEDFFLNHKPAENMQRMIPSLYDPTKKFSDFSEQEQEELIRYDRYMCSFSENFNDFTMRVYAVNQVYHFLWVLHAEPWREEEVTCFKGYDRSLQFATATYNDIEKLFNEVLSTFPEKAKGYRRS